MAKTHLILATLLLSACSSGGGSPPIVSAPGWTALYSVGIGPCDDFNFGELHYCVKQQRAQVGQTISLTFTISGSGTLYPVESADSPPATLRLFVASDPSGTTRWWCPTSRTDLTPGTHTVSCVISSEWTGVGGGYPTPPIGNINYIGYTMGGQSFAGHGVRANGPVHFHLDNGNLSTKRYQRKLVSRTHRGHL
jgi:hypothetical protein